MHISPLRWSLSFELKEHQFGHRANSPWIAPCAQINQLDLSEHRHFHVQFNLDIDNNRSNIRSCLQYWDRQSTERQVKDLSEYAKYKGIKVSKVFEEHISGAKIVQTERNEVCFNCRGAAYLM